MSQVEDGLLRLENVHKTYQSPTGPKTILDGINLEISKGEFVALVGPSGAGKSTLLRLILGEEQPTSGRLSLDGTPLGYPDTRRGIVPQNYGLFPHLTVVENIMLADRLTTGLLERRHSFTRSRERADALLHEAGLVEQKDKYPYQLSGGQCQRAAVMQALAKSPKILLMDEPFGALDPGTRERMQVFLIKLWEREKKTILFVTHDLEEAVFVAPRVVALSSLDYTSKHGSRVVFDKLIREQVPLSTEAKKDPRFTETIEHIRDIAFETDVDSHIHAFDANHSRVFEPLVS